MQNQSFVLDTENLVRAGKVPLIISGALGITWLLRIYLGYLGSPAITFLEAFAGAMYMKTILDSGKKPLLFNAGINGAILGGVALVVYVIVSWISGSIVAKEWSFDVVSLIFNALEGAFVGLLGSLAWFSYKTHANN